MKAFDLIMSNPDVGACSDLRNFATASFLLKFKPMSQWIHICHGPHPLNSHRKKISIKVCGLFLKWSENFLLNYVEELLKTNIQV